MAVTQSLKSAGPYLSRLAENEYAQDNLREAALLAGGAALAGDGIRRRGAAGAETASTA